MALSLSSTTAALRQLQGGKDVFEGGAPGLCRWLWAAPAWEGSPGSSAGRGVGGDQEAVSLCRGKPVESPGHRFAVPPLHGVFMS